MPQREIELLHKTDDEDRQQTGADPSNLVLVRKGVHAARGDCGYCDYAGLDQREAPVIALIVVVARDPLVDVPDPGADSGRAVVLVEIESQHIFLSIKSSIVSVALLLRRHLFDALLEKFGDAILLLDPGLLFGAVSLVDLAQVLYQPRSQVLAPLGKLLVSLDKLLIPLGHLSVLLDQ